MDWQSREELEIVNKPDNDLGTVCALGNGLVEEGGRLRAYLSFCRLVWSQPIHPS